MKDIVISKRAIRRELYIFLASFFFGFLVNIYAIIIYDRPWIELLTQLGWVVFIAFLVYILLAIIRIIVYLIIKLFNILRLPRRPKGSSQ